MEFDGIQDQKGNMGLSQKGDTQTNACFNGTNDDKPMQPWEFGALDLETTATR